MGNVARLQTNRPARRDASVTKARILEAALGEFSRYGLAGARIDTIAENALVSKPMIYSYFGDKDTLYRAALREAYVQIRDEESNLKTAQMSPEDAVRELVRFTLNHYVRNPWFIMMLNTENLLGGETVRTIADVAEIQSPLIDQIRDFLQRGAETGEFRQGVDPVDFYISVASLCYFPVSNKHTLRAIFGVPIDAAWLERRAIEAGEMMVRSLRPDASNEGK